ncbi:MAG: LemA family protein [Armatimonadetes bacterium]|nr:LemA family protein [Armatimonadota bacterium]
MGSGEWVLLLAVALFLMLLAYAYNALARMRNVVRGAWSDIDVQLKRRADLVPNLVETAKGYAGFEQTVLQEVVRARSGASAGQMGPARRAAAEEELAARIERVIAVVEAYPELKSSAHFMRLQEELSETEDSIANARRYYNAAVRDFGTMLDSFPLGLVGLAFRFRKAEFFSVTDPVERRAPSARMDK